MLVFVFVDNASWHKSATVRDELKKFKGEEVKLRYCYLSHTQELNSEETQRNVVRNAIGNRACDDTRQVVGRPANTQDDQE